MRCVLVGCGRGWADMAQRAPLTRQPILPSGLLHCRTTVPRVAFSTTESPLNGNFGAGELAPAEPTGLLGVLSAKQMGRDEPLRGAEDTARWTNRWAMKELVKS